MNVKELKELLKNLPDDTEVVVVADASHYQYYERVRRVETKQAEVTTNRMWKYVSDNYRESKTSAIVDVVVIS